MECYIIRFWVVLEQPATLCHALLVSSHGQTAFIKLDLQFLCPQDHLLYIQIRMYCCQCLITPRLRLHEVPADKHIAQTRKVSSPHVAVIMDNTIQSFFWPNVPESSISLGQHRTWSLSPCTLIFIRLFCFLRLEKKEIMVEAGVFKRVFISLVFMILWQRKTNRTVRATVYDTSHLCTIFCCCLVLFTFLFSLLLKKGKGLIE